MLRKILGIKMVTARPFGTAEMWKPAARSRVRQGGTLQNCPPGGWPGWSLPVPACVCVDLVPSVISFLSGSPCLLVRLVSRTVRPGGIHWTRMSGIRLYVWVTIWIYSALCLWSSARAVTHPCPIRLQQLLPCLQGIKFLFWTWAADMAYVHY